METSNYPTIEELGAIFDNPQEVLDILNMDIEKVIEKYPAAKRRIDECYNRPADYDIRFHVINDLGKFYGVEAFAICQNAIRSDDYVDYLNAAGDTYATTLLHHKGVYFVSTWGDAYEKYSEEED
jgi:hypothetical protein